MPINEPVGKNVHRQGKHSSDTSNHPTRPRKDDKPPRPLTVKRQKFVMNKVNGMRNDKAYKQAGYKASNRHVAEVEASKLLKKPDIQLAIQKELRIQNITLKRAITPISDALDATDKDGETNYNVRLKASDMALHLLGAKQQQVTGVHFHKHLHDKGAEYNL